MSPKKTTHKKHKKWFYALRRQRFAIMAMLLMQVVVVTYIVISSSLASKFISYALTALSFVVALKIVAKQEKEAYKLTWIFMILAAPIFGGLFYLLFRWQTSEKRVYKQLIKSETRDEGSYAKPCDRFPEVEQTMPDQVPAVRYLQQKNFPVFTKTQTEFLSPGEKWHKDMLCELEKAEKYIFFEYFIMEEGIFWDSILEILKRKAAQGVDVRIIYDDLGCFLRLPKNYDKILEDMGIKCLIFNKFRPVFSGLQNNRDHRKITVIDGKVAYTGGANLADEYINAVQKHGYWKDATIKLCGEAVWSLTLMFLQMWSACKNENEDVANFYPWKECECTVQTDGFVQPYADSPLDKENIGENVYAQIIQNTKEYLYINTPYLIVDDTMRQALTLAAKSGIDVRIITPEVYDKLFVHLTTRSYYREFLAAGVKIYEYKGGFNHAKTFVSDGRVATVGTTNLDYRSLYLHFECGVRLAGSSTVLNIRDDFLQSLEKCKEISPEDCKAKLPVRIFQDILRLFAPLM